MMRTALIVNDDGYKSAGIRALQAELGAHYNARAIAPAGEQSWKGKSISGYHQPLTLERKTYHEFDGFIANGTPADCAQLGLYELFETLPDFVVSGINNGANIGHAHIISSGTVGAAFEAAFQGVPAFASSVWGMYRDNPNVDFNDPDTTRHFRIAAGITRRIIDKVMAAGFPKSVQVIAINIPVNAKADAPWLITRPHSVSYGRLFQLDGEVYRNTGSAELKGDEAPNTDLEAIAKGNISIVPISLQLTTDAGRQELSRILDAPIFGE